MNANRSLALLIGVLGLGAIANRFVQDDAFISYRYAANWVNGHGLVWNVGDRVEGYTNFLWTVLMGLPLALGADPVVFSQALGIVCFLGTLWLTARLAARFSYSPTARFVTVLLLGSNYTFSCYATGGLETQAQALLWVASLLLADRVLASGVSVPGALGVSVIAAIALLLRLDSAIFVGIVLLAVASRSIRRPAVLAALVLPVLTIGAAFFAWRLGYYGDWLPNSFQVKVASGTSIPRGLYFVGLFGLVYLLFPVLAYHVFLVRRFVRELGLERWVLLAIPLCLWWAYVIWVGGDFMEFRLLVPSLPALYLIVGWTLSTISSPKWAVPGLCAVLLVASVVHAWTFHTSPLRRGIESIDALRAHVEGPSSWPVVGRSLARHFDATDGVTIALTPAGAIPYYALDLEFVDMIGINDREIARSGVHLSNRPGHQRIASVARLRDRGVHLVVGHPMVRRTARFDRTSLDVSDLRQMFVAAPVPDPESIPDDAVVVRIPIDDGVELLALYLNDHPLIDARIASGEYRFLPLRRDGS